MGPRNAVLPSGQSQMLKGNLLQAACAYWLLQGQGCCKVEGTHPPGSGGPQGLCRDKGLGCCSSGVCPPVLTGYMESAKMAPMSGGTSKVEAECQKDACQYLCLWRASKQVPNPLTDGSSLADESPRCFTNCCFSAGSQT